MYRVWYSTESFADYIIDHTALSGKPVIKNRIYESDANNPTRFHTMPDHIRKILYLSRRKIDFKNKSKNRCRSYKMGRNQSSYIPRA